jgi:hypothetical protein
LPATSFSSRASGTCSLHYIARLEAEPNGGMLVIEKPLRCGGSAQSSIVIARERAATAALEGPTFEPAAPSLLGQVAKYGWSDGRTFVCARATADSLPFEIQRAPLVRSELYWGPSINPLFADWLCGCMRPSKSTILGPGLL